MTKQPSPDSTTAWIQDRLDRIAAGQDHTVVRDELLRRASQRIHDLVRAAMRSRPDLGRWEQDEDVLQNVLLRVDRAVRDARPANPGQFFIIVAQHVRWATIDLIRHHFGPGGQSSRHRTAEIDADGVSADPTSPRNGPAIERIDFIRLHAAVDGLPAEERDAWHLFVYLGLTQDQTAEHLGISPKTVQRRVRSARLQLATRLDDFRSV